MAYFNVYAFLYLIIIYNIVCLSYKGTVNSDNLNQNLDSNDLRITSNMNLHSDYLSKNNVPLIKKHMKKKGKIRFKCLHCDYLTFRKQNLVGHLRQKHEVYL